jgi:antitoxin ParD1/3/4
VLYLEAEETSVAKRMLEERQSRIEALRQALVDGEHSAVTTPIDMAEIKRKARSSPGRKR